MKKQTDPRLEDPHRDPPTGWRLPISGCLYVIFLCALCGIMVNECKRSKIRLNRDRSAYEYYQDSVKGQTR